MTITLEEINRVTLRNYRRFFEERLRDCGVALPTPWEPSDEELARVAKVFVQAYSEVYGSPYP